MADDAFTGIDKAYERAGSRRTQRAVTIRHTVVSPPDDDRWHDTLDDEVEDPIGSRVVILFLVAQFLVGAALLLPGAQSVRGYVRGLPYVVALVPLAYYIRFQRRGWWPAGAGLLLSALLLLCVGLLHPSTQLTAGMAQCLFQLAIVAPFFWASKAIRSPRQLERVLLLAFAFNLVGATVGILQVYDPDRFLPAQFSQQLRDDYLMSLSYEGTDGRLITRPPGLSDVPGGAAVAGGLTALLGLCLSFRTPRVSHRVLYLSAVAVGLAVIYLTQVRSTLLMAMGAVVVLTLVTFRRGQLKRAAWMIGSGSALLAASFLWASSLGGSAVDQRFLNIQQQGALSVYQESRGNFLAYTFGEMLDTYPFGAGVGRWGMMNAYFGDPDAFASEPIYVEIQLTGWLLDGGVLMWLLYGGAILWSLVAVFRLTDSDDPQLADAAATILTVGVFIVGLSFAGPAFNTQLGVLFWFLAAGARGASLQGPASDHFVGHESDGA